MKVGFIGCGNMGGALARAVLRVSGAEVFVSDANSVKAEAFAKENGAFASSNSDIARDCDFIFLGVKPNVFSTVLASLSKEIAENKKSVIVSMAAGVSLEMAKAALNSSHPIIRIMPNTPAAIGEGMITWCKNEFVSNEQTADFLKILSPAGKLDEIPEKLIDAASAVAGCGPAFAYMFIEALADGAVACGLPRDKAILYACEMLRGSASMVMKTGKHPGLLKDEVCSPGGSTIEGVGALEDGAFRGTVSSAVTAAFDKTKKLV